LIHDFPTAPFFQGIKSLRAAEIGLVGAPHWTIDMAMTEPESKILQALVELASAVKSMPTSDPKPDLLRLFSRLDDLTGQLPKETDRTLLHYLHQKSYEKARLWLEGREAENQAGSCRH